MDLVRVLSGRVRQGEEGGSGGPRDCEGSGVGGCPATGPPAGPARLPAQPRQHLPLGLQDGRLAPADARAWFLFFMLFNMGAFFSMSGRIRKRICPTAPDVHLLQLGTRPSLYVTVMLDICKGNRPRQ